MSKFTDLLLKRRSIRTYKDKKVPDDLLEKIIEEATYAPSSGNEQPWRFVVVTNKELMREISDDAKKNLVERIQNNPDDALKKYEKMLQNQSYNIFHDAPALVFILGDKSLKNSAINCALAASYFMFSATDKGLGTCWVHFATAVSSGALLSKLGITEKDLIAAPIVIGYPDVIPEMPKRKELKVVKID